MIFVIIFFVEVNKKVLHCNFVLKVFTFLQSCSSNKLIQKLFAILACLKLIRHLILTYLVYGINFSIGR